jgi:hypothetical protein
MPTVTVREYNTSTGALHGNIQSLSFGKVAQGKHSPIKVIDFTFTGISVASNIKVGLVSSGGVIVNDVPEDIANDGSSSTGKFGIEHSSSFDSIIAKGPLRRHFSGLNQTGLSTDGNNVTIGTRSEMSSQYTYLDIEAPSNEKGIKGGTYRLFFDFE